MKENYEKELDTSTKVQLFESIFDHLTLGIAIVTPQMDILKANHQFYEIIKSHDADSTSQNSTPSFWEQPNVKAFLSACFENADYNTTKDFEWLQEDGAVTYIRIHSQLLPKEIGAPISILLSLSDMSEIKQSEKVHDNSVRHLMHELRNPLSNISLCVELLADSTKDSNQEDTDLFLSKAATSVQRMKQLISDLSATRKSA